MLTFLTGCEALFGVGKVRGQEVGIGHTRKGVRFSRNHQAIDTAPVKLPQAAKRRGAFFLCRATYLCGGAVLRTKPLRIPNARATRIFALNVDKIPKLS